MWMTFNELAERFDITPEAARQRAIRGNLKRQIGNDGKIKVDLPDDFYVPEKRKHKKKHICQTEETSKQKQTNPNKELERLIAALEAHIASLERELSFVREQLQDERFAAEESLLFVKKLTQEIAELKSATNPVKELQKKIEVELPVAVEEEPITGMSVILKRLEILKAAKAAA